MSTVFEISSIQGDDVVSTDDAQLNKVPGDASAPHSEAGVILSTLTALVEPLAALLPGECEVVLHDLGDLSGSIVAIAGNLTGRRVGGPAPEWLVLAQQKGTLGTSLGHSAQHPDGHELRNSTLIFRDASGAPVAALCVLNDTRDWAAALQLARSMLPWTHDEPRDEPHDSGTPAATEILQDVDGLARQVLARALASVDVPVDLMQKRHKLAIVRELNDSGYFLLRESVEKVAQALGVTRFTIYNYIGELTDAAATEQ